MGRTVHNGAVRPSAGEPSGDFYEFRGTLTFSRSLSVARRLSALSVALGALVGAFSSVAAQSRVSDALPPVSLDLLAGAGSGHADVRPTARASLGIRFGPARRIAPIVLLEAGIEGSGYRWNVLHFRSDGTTFDPPSVLTEVGGGVGVRAALAHASHLGASAGFARLSPLGRTGSFADVDATLTISRSVALVVGVRHMRYFDPDARVHRSFTPIVGGIRFSIRG